MATKQMYGFRYDPLKWAREDDSTEAAMVRLEFLDSASDEDSHAIRKATEVYVRKLREKMDLCDPPAMRHDLIQVACRHGLLDSAELGTLILDTAERDDQGLYDAYSTIALCSVGFAGEPEVVRSVEKVAQEVMNDNPWQTCPWGMFLKLRALWLGRDAVDIHEAFEKQLDVVAGNSNEVGPFYDKDPLSRVDICGIIKHPKTKAILEQSLPMILRGQLPDGGWGRRSFQVFRALYRNGMIDSLRERSPLPPDWHTVKTIPTPCDGLFTMTSDGERLWVLRPKTQELFALSPDDGCVLVKRTLKEENLGGIGWVDSAIAVTQSEPKRLLRVDPESGDVTELRSLKETNEMGGVAECKGKVLVCDTWMPAAWEYDAEGDTSPEYRCLGGCCGLAVEGDEVWRFDWLAPLLIKTDVGGTLTDYGDLPFEREVQGIAHDGEQLWILDNQERRICAIDKATQPSDLQP